MLLLLLLRGGEPQGCKFCATAVQILCALLVATAVDFYGSAQLFLATLCRFLVSYKPLAEPRNR